jgi:hypothetical protein
MKMNMNQRFYILQDKFQFFPGETIKGKVMLIPYTNGYIDDIQLTFKLLEIWCCPYNNPKQNERNDQIISQFDVGVKKIFNLPPNQPLYVTINTQYTFPFELKLETYLSPSFEYPTDTHRCFLRYILEAKIKSNQIMGFASTYILINAIKKKEKDSDNLNVEKSLSIKKWGLFSKGSTKLKAFYPTKNYGFSDTIPIRISIDNSQSQLKVTETKI